MHSHSGLDTWPFTEGSSDTNEMAESPLHPELRSIDGYDPSDLSISIINAGGVTTSLILPGSGNMMGGEAFAIKHRFLPSNRTSDMLLNAGINSKNDGPAWRWMKMACGENPIRSYGVAHWVMPESRLGEAYLFRKRISAARDVLRKQDQWCSRYHDSRPLFEPYPEPIEHESLVALLRGKILLNVHCYETFDMEMMVKLSHEFDFKINTFHHALEAWRVGEMLKEEGIAVALFVNDTHKADHWGYKKEAYDASTKAAKILTDKGVKVAFKSDHPVLNAQNLIFEAAKGHHYGLSFEKSIQSVTSVPAERIGQSHRIGHVKVGYDADLVVWDKNPLEIGAHPLRVFVDGYSTFQHAEYQETIQESYYLHASSLDESKKLDIVIPESLPSGAITFFNISGLVHSAQATHIPGSKIVVEYNNITCVGPACEDKGHVVNLKGGWVIPGMIAVDAHLGLEVISSEKATSAGMVDPENNRVNSGYGLRVGRKNNRLLDAAFKAGVTTAVSALRFSGSIGPINVAFRTGSDSVNTDTIIKYGQRECRVGENAKRPGPDSSIPGQIFQIWQSMCEIIYVNAANHIFHFASRNITFIGGAEAHKAIPALHEGHSLVLSPARCTPSDWSKQDCILSSVTPTAVDIMQAAGINVGVAVSADNMVRGLIWEAGWKIADSTKYKNMSDFEFAKEVTSLVTWNIAKAFNLEKTVGEIRIGLKPNFVVYDGIPGTLKAHVILVVDGELMETKTEQY